MRKAKFAGGAVVVSAALLTPASAAGYRNIFWDTHSPTKHWSTKDFVAHSTGQIRYGVKCQGWSGNVVHVKLVRTSTHDVRRDSADGCAPGQWLVWYESVPVGAAFYLRISVHWDCAFTVSVDESA